MADSNDNAVARDRTVDREMRMHPTYRRGASPFMARILVGLIVMTAICVAARSTSSIKGWLVLEGGGKLRNTAVLHRFVSLAGGRRARLVLIPTAAIRNMGWQFDAAFVAKETEWAKDVFAIDDVTIVHTYDRKEADTGAFVEPLRRATAVWIEGGDDTPLYDAYAGTLTQKEIRAVLDRGGVVGGTSAGASVLGSMLLKLPKKTAEASANSGDAPVIGFGLFDSVIHPHFTTRNRQVEMSQFLESHPGLLGLGIDETTAAVIHGDQLEVVGEGSVAVYDGKRHGERDYVALSDGQKFDLRPTKLNQ